MFADLVVLSQDIFSIDVEKLTETRVIMTICDAKIVHNLLD